MEVKRYEGKGGERRGEEGRERREEGKKKGSGREVRKQNKQF